MEHSIIFIAWLMFNLFLMIVKFSWIRIRCLWFAWFLLEKHFVFICKWIIIIINNINICFFNFLLLFWLIISLISIREWNNMSILVLYFTYFEMFIILHKNIHFFTPIAWNYHFFIFMPNWIFLTQIYPIFYPFNLSKLSPILYFWNSKL